MSKPDKMPTPFRHKKFGTYYLKKRVPQDIKHLWQETDPVQISLGTKDESEAHIRISREWLKLQDRFNELRRLAARQVGLCEERINTDCQTSLAHCKSMPITTRPISHISGSRRTT